jgi:hypothetical protein
MATLESLGSAPLESKRSRRAEQIDPCEPKATQSRFGRGRGNGTGPRTTTTLCTGCWEYWNAAGARKGAVGSSERALRTLGDFWMEPVNRVVSTSLQTDRKTRRPTQTSHDLLRTLLRHCWRSHLLWTLLHRPVPARGRLCRSHPQG